MEKKFRSIVRKAELAAGEPILLAVSGGIDSVVLLELFSRIAESFALELHVLHLDHQIRPESGKDAEFVKNLCADKAVPCYIEKADVPALSQERRVSLETAGRDVRREVLLARAKDSGCTKIVLAHHQDDQAETFMMRLLRGSGQSGLRGMGMHTGIWWRPLLDFSRQQIESYASENKLSWVEDASNSDTRFLRNRIRHKLLPELREYNPQINFRLTSLSQQFQLEEDYWQRQVLQIWPQVILSDADGLRLDRVEILNVHPALQMRLLREALRRVRGDLRSIETVHLEAMLGLLNSDRSQAELDLPDCWVARRYGQLWLRPDSPEIKVIDLPVEVGVPQLLPDGRFLLAEIGGAGDDAGPDREVFDMGRLEFPLRVRSFQPGDRFRPFGMNNSRKLKDFLIDLKLEKEERLSLPLLLNKDEILWLVGLRRSALEPVVANTQETLIVRLIEAASLETKPL